MTVIHPALGTAKVIADRIAAVMGVAANVSVEEVSMQVLANKAKNSEKHYIVVSPEDCTRTAASRRKVRTGTCLFTLQISVTKHTGTVKPSNFEATKEFFDTVQTVIDAAMGITVAYPDGQDISLPSPWGLIRWPEELTEIPGDEELIAMSIRSRTIQFNFQAIRGA